MQICVLGPLEIRLGSGSVLALLVLQAPRIVSADRLVDTLWGEQLPEDPGGALRTQVSRLRALLADAGAAERLRRGEATGYGLMLAPAEIDARVFSDLQGRALSASTASLAVELADEALALWRDEPFGEFAELPHFLGEATPGTETDP
ncbi:MAG: helix-turn-helix domain-containing protein [Gemmatimonadota bacterium]